MKKIHKTCGILIILTGCVFVFLAGCRKDEPDIFKEKVTGCVQKGPFVNGTSILMVELTSSLQQTGKNFTTQIMNNAGYFEIENVGLESSFVEFSASGYYFDEIKGELSISPLDLSALSDITDISTVNVNLLTHLEKQRVGYLVGQGLTFTEAKTSAQQEILSIFGFEISNMNASESLDITINNTSNAILLAISVLLQGNRSVGDLTELLANIINDIREDGILNNANILESIRNSAKELNLEAIRTNLESRFQELEIYTVAPDFEEYVNTFLAHTGLKPDAITLEATNRTETGVTLNALVNPNSLSTVVTFEYGTSDSYGNTITSSQSPLTGNFPVRINTKITGLSLATNYHFRVKAENSLGITYGEDMEFTSLCPITDIEGNIYKTVNIGDQDWMAENLKTTKYNNGDAIATTDPSTLDIHLEIAPSFQWAYDSSDVNVDTYGRLYTWAAANDSRGVCPDGWHVPTDEEWTTLTDYLGGLSVAGSKLKEAGIEHWTGSNEDATNESGFTALPAGQRRGIGTFENIGYACHFWASTWDMTSNAYSRKLLVGSTEVIRDFGPLRGGFSIRCIKDQ